ncbi:protein kinase [Polymorphospora sp. NPDC051019]|uniref:protein kinase domain-containing protein n=1 Tax=Polymorphospora sp. NPDC051019 TaxID=3155725 RepID=UPI0034425FFB
MPGGTTYFFVGPPEEPDKYRLLRQVGGGGEAELWQADVALGAEREKVAVKVLRSAHEDRAAWRSRWIEQTDLLRLIRHPGVVGVHAAFEGARMHHAGAADPTETALYLVMNWIEGTDLRDWPARQSGPPAAVFTCLTQVADVLDWLHSGKATPSRRPVVHGDISPANVIVNRDGQAVLVDFGLFRMSSHVTNLPAGTQGYIAPEVLRDGAYSPASDRYAFGGLAYFLLTGAHPPATADARAAGLHAVFGPTPLLDHALRIFADDPAARPAAGEWVRNLRAQTSTTTTTPTGLPPMRPGAAPSGASAGGPVPAGVSAGGDRRPRPWWLAVAGAALALVLVAGVLGAVSLLGGENAGDRAESGSTAGAGDPTGGPEQPGGTASPAPGPSGDSPTPGPDARGTEVYLVSLKAREKPNMDEEIGVATIDDREYPSSISRSCYGVSLEYHLGYDYTRFRSTVGLDDESDSGSSATFVVYVDDERQDSATVRLAATGTVEADLTGAFRLRIEAEIAGGWNCGVTTVFADPILTK